MKTQDFPDGKNFSIVLGGPFFQLMRKAHLTGDALELVKKRTLIISMVAWLPLFVLSIFEQRAWGSKLELPFIEDLEVQVRFLLAVPLMVIAELMVHDRMRVIVKQFQDRNLIPEHGTQQFSNAIASAFRLRNSMVAEILMIALIYFIGYNIVWEKSMAVNASTWYESSSGNGIGLSLAGIWFRYVSLPVFQFLFLRWYYRIFIWARFLFQISKIKLRLIPTHPDNLGGLGFISNIVFAFMPLAFMHGVVMAGMIANHIFHEGTTLLDYKINIIVVTLLVLLIVCLPLFFFTGQLSETKRSGGLLYGLLATRYVRDFEEKWIKEKNNEPLLGTGDIQSLSDLQNTIRTIRDMSMLPVTRSDIIMLIVATIAPVLPLALTMMPLSELIKMLAGFFL